MRKRFPNIVRVLLALALVAGLVAITAAPAGATAITVGSVTVTPPTANSVAGYSISVTTSSSAYSANDAITITFPAGTVLPTSVGYQYVTVAGEAILLGEAAPYVSGQNLVITITDSTMATAVDSGTFVIVVSPGAGITNPPLSYTAAALAYLMGVTTTHETLGQVAYAIDDYVSFSPSAAAYGTAVTVTGGGFASGSTVTITGGASGSGTVGTDGKFSASAAAILDATAVTATDGTGREADSSINLTLLPTLTVTAPTSGNVGATVNLQGRNFTDDSNINDLGNVTFGGSDFTALSATLTRASDQADQIDATLTDLDQDSVQDDFNAYFTVPAASSPGVTEITVRDAGGKIGAVNYTVNPRTAAIAPVTGGPSTQAVVSGTGFAPGITDGTLVYASQPSLTTVTGLSTDADGSFSQVITIPSGAASGALTMAVTFSGTTKTVTFVVADRLLNITPSSGPLGTLVMISASGMTASSEVDPNNVESQMSGGGGTLTIAGANMLANNSSTTGNYATTGIAIDSGGNLAATTVAITTGIATGAQTITATDRGGRTASGAFTVTKPSIEISPAEGYMGTTLSITGTGWVPGSRGVVSLNSTNTTVAITTIPKTDGTFSASMVVPIISTISATTRIETFTAADIMVNSAVSQQFRVSTASISAEPTSGAASDTITLTGVGFVPNTAVTAVTVGGATVTTSPTVPITNSVGEFELTFTLPGVIGVQTIQATVYGTARTTFVTITAAPATVASALSAISAELVRVWGYAAGAWQMHDPVDLVGSDLTSLTEGSGYWVKVDADVTLVFGGNSWVLTSGWNLIGW